MSLNIFTGNRMEHLVAALGEVVAQPLVSPFTPEVIVVQSKGMQRWLAMQLASRFGVWANGDYPFPNRMVRQLFAAVFPDLPDMTPFAPEVMSWRIMALLPDLVSLPEFAPLKQYLADDPHGLKLFQLSSRIADTFDQYTLFRPEMLRQWEEHGEPGQWQATLWRRLAAGGGSHRGRLKFDFCRFMEDGLPEGISFPQRISLFGISYLPPYHLDMLDRAARVTQVNLFLLSPCREYWGDIMPARDRVRRTPEEQEYLVEGNPLLASLGRLGRDFSRMVIGEAVTSAEADLYEEPGEATLLATLQSDILSLRSTSPSGTKRAIAPGDRSVQIHSCHSPLREIEVLHDNLLALLEADPGIAPRDIVVMTPDIETYAPYISLVFHGEQDPAKRIPFSIADRSLAGEGEAAGVLLRLLALPGSRLTAAALFDILETAPVMRRFELASDDLPLIREWLEETRIRWGADERQRAALGLPPFRENSWGAGLDRLILGYAMPDEGGRLFNGILPFDEMEGGRTRVLGRFADFVRAALGIAETLAAPRTLTEWGAALTGLLADFVAADDDGAPEVAALAGVAESLAELGKQAGFSGQVGLPVFRAWFTARLAGEERGYGFMTGGVTFCAMLPMRSIPFRVVALVGMNASAFPRQARPPGFDLVARHPRPGDRSLRDEDRYLFLECLLSARDCLYLSYVGQSIRDNSVIPPSVLVSEFLDTLESGFTAGEGKVAERLVTHHRLQAFSRAYFTEGSVLTSYSTENCAALVAAREQPWAPAPFLSAPLAEPPEEWRDVPLSRLVRFFANPAKFLLEHRLGIRLEELVEPLEEREPFDMGGLDAYAMKEEILSALLAGSDPDELLPRFRSRGLLPPARHGEELFATTVREVDGFAQRLRPRITGPPLAPLELDLTLGEYRLHGRLDGIYPDRKVNWRCATLKAKDQLRCWIEHVALNVADREGYPCASHLVMTDGVISFEPVAQAEAVLRSLLDLYREGLTMPLPLIPESSLAYADKEEWNLDKALKCWAPTFGERKGEQDDPYFRLCFGREPFTPDFDRVSRALLGPLVRHRRKESP